MSLGQRTQELFLALNLLAAPWVWGECSRLTLEPEAPHYIAGEPVVVHIPLECWGKAEEGELLLQLPDSKLREVRLTPSQTAPWGVVHATIPHFPGVLAWFEMRAGSGGREWIAARSPGFLIVPSVQRPIASLVHHQGEWWLRSHPAPNLHVKPTPQGLRARVEKGELLVAALQKNSSAKPSFHLRLPLEGEGIRAKQPSLPQIALCQAQVSLPLRE